MKFCLISLLIFCACTNRKAELLKEQTDVKAQIRQNILDSLSVIEANSSVADSFMHIEMSLNIHDIKANDSIVHIIDSVKKQIIQKLKPRLDSIKQINAPLRMKYDSLTSELKKIQ